VVIGGLVFLSLLQWSLGTLVSLGYAAQAGPRGVLRFLVDGLFGLLIACVLIRVIASWLGISSYAKWMRPIAFLTDWLLEPLRRLIPPLGMFDISPLVAWLLLILARSLVLGLL
jgi:YggT family protein